MNAINRVALFTILNKETMRIFRIWAQALLPPVISMTLYFAIFGQLIGSRLGSVSGVSYLKYIAPGLIMMAVMNNSYANVVASFYGARFQRSIEEMLVAPLAHSTILLGFTVGGVIRGCVVAVLITLIALLFTHLPVKHPWLLLFYLFDTAMLFSLAGFTNALYARNFDDISIIPTFIIAPLSYFGGVFYSVDMLPPLLRTVSHLNPILYIVNAFRFSLLGVSDVNITIATIILIALTILLFLWNLHLLNRGVGIRN